MNQSNGEDLKSQRMSDKVIIQVDFDQLNVRNGVIEMLASNLKDETDRDASKSSLKESLAMIQKGNKVPYGPANHLLLSILRSLSLVDDIEGDETFQISSQEKENTIHGPTSGATTSEEANENPENQIVQTKTPKYGKKDNLLDPNSKVNKTKTATCRFYMNGKCKFKADCRFAHPKICPKFRQDGDCEVKGCGGDCDLLHPNVCHNSLKDKTCPYAECRFFHLKGTKLVEKNSGPSKSNDRNWKAKQNGVQNSGQYNQKKETNRAAPKNGKTSLNGRTKKKDSSNQSFNRDQTPKKETVTQKEKNQLGQTLEAIMRRLDAMEARPAFLPQVQPLLSPAAPQFSWTQGPWTQTQTQSQK